MVPLASDKLSSFTTELGHFFGFCGLGQVSW